MRLLCVLYAYVCPFLCMCPFSIYASITMIYMSIYSVINCGDPGQPHNGFRSFDSTLLNAIVTYTCPSNLQLYGNKKRVCQSNGLWSGQVPSCGRKKNNLEFLKLLLTQPLTVEILEDWLMDNGSFLEQQLVKWSHTFVTVVSN